VPYNALQVTPSFAATGCCYDFNLSQVWDQPSRNIQKVVATILTPNVTVTSASGAGGTTWTSSTITWPFQLTNYVACNCETVGACFTCAPPAGTQIQFVGYDINGNTHAGWSQTVTLPENPACLACGCMGPPPGLALWLPFDETTGGGVGTILNAVGLNATPYHGQNVVATATSGPSPVAGEVANGLSFNGSSDYVSVPWYNGLQIGGDFSIAALVRLTNAVPSSQVILDNHTEDSFGDFKDGFQLYLANGKIGFRMANGQTQSPLWNSGLAVPDDNQWHFVVVSVQRNSSAGVTFYLDNVIGTSTFTPLLGTLRADTPVMVGCENSQALGTLDKFFHGSLDEVMIFQSAVAGPSESSMYKAGSSGLCKLFVALPPYAVGCPCCFIPNYSSSVGVSAVFGNLTTSAQTYSFSLSDSGCALTPLTFNPASGSITVPPGQFKRKSFAVGVPPGKTGQGCYQMAVTTEGQTRYYSSTVEWNSGNPCWVLANASANLNLSGVLVNNSNPNNNYQWNIQGLLGAPVNLGYDMVVLNNAGNIDTEFVSLNGQVPGTAVTGALDVPENGSTNLSASIEFVNYDPLGTYTLLLEEDAGDGVLTPVGAVSFLNSIGTRFDLDVSYSEAGVVLEWSELDAVLQQAGSLSGPWTDVVGATSPWTVAPSGPGQFYRLRE
jgi:hypothetical protein